VASHSPLAEPLSSFEHQMRYAARWFTVLPVGDFTNAVANLPVSENVLAVTFDDGFADNETIVRPLLTALGIRATFFVVTGSLGRRLQTSGGQFDLMSPAQVKSLAAAGHEIGSHTVSHQRLPEVSIEAATREIVDSKRALEDLVGLPVTSFAYPKGRVTEAVRQSVQDAGYHRAVTTRRAFVRSQADPFMLPRLSIRDYVRLSTAMILPRLRRGSGSG